MSFGIGRLFSKADGHLHIAPPPSPGYPVAAATPLASERVVSRSIAAQEQIGSTVYVVPVVNAGDSAYRWASSPVRSNTPGIFNAASGGYRDDQFGDRVSAITSSSAAAGNRASASASKGSPRNVA
jgi:hypothetical protein